MHYEIQDESEQGRFVLKMSGTFSLDGHLVMLKELVSHPNWKIGMNLFVDGTQISLTGFSVDKIRSVAASVVNVANLIGPCRHAIVCPEGEYTKASMFTFLTEVEVGWTSKLFNANEYEDAISWVEKGEDL